MAEAGDTTQPSDASERSRADATRDAILAATAALVSHDGVSKLTLARVADRAGVSKGGLLHHFGSKQALIAAALDHTLESADQALHALAVANGRPRGSFAQAYIDYVRDPDHTANAAAAILAAATLELDDPQAAAAQFDRWRQRLANDGLDDATATLVRVVSDGLWLIDLFDLAPPDPEQRKAMLDQVEQLLPTD